MKKIALIVAGGSGLRMGASIPKQFLLLKGKPVLMHTIERFAQADMFDSLIVVLPASEIEHWKKLIKEHSFTIKHNVVTGGSSRFESVKKGLESITESEGHIAIHDGVRPLVNPLMIRFCMGELNNYTNVIPAVAVTDTIRKTEDDNSETVDRECLRAVQTPQCFHLDLLKKAYSRADGADSTDDAGVFEKAGNKIHLVEGEKSNIKITVHTDLLMAESFLHGL